MSQKGQLERSSTMKIRKNTKGFTLVEIMIVVAIIGLLAAIAVPNFVQARTQARTNTCVNNLRFIQAAKDQYAIENNQADTVVPTAANISVYFKASQLSGGLPKEPQSGTYSILAVNVAPTCSVGNPHTI